MHPVTHPAVVSTVPEHTGGKTNPTTSGLWDTRRVGAGGVLPGSPATPLGAGLPLCSVASSNKHLCRASWATSPPQELSVPGAKVRRGLLGGVRGARRNRCPRAHPRKRRARPSDRLGSPCAQPTSWPVESTRGWSSAARAPATRAVFCSRELETAALPVTPHEAPCNHQSRGVRVSVYAHVCLCAHT